MITNCKQCNKEFKVKPFQILKGWGKFCSSECHYQYRKDNRISYTGIGENSHLWKGGRKLTSEGYYEIYQPHHPRALKQSGQSAYVKEHILVAEKYLGRFLNSGEVVHHIDFNKINNNPENLYVFLTGGEHTAYHHSLNRGDSFPLISNLINLK